MITPGSGQAPLSLALCIVVVWPSHFPFSSQDNLLANNGNIPSSLIQSSASQNNSLLQSINEHHLHFFDTLQVFYSHRVVTITTHPLGEISSSLYTHCSNQQAAKLSSTKQRFFSINETMSGSIFGSSTTSERTAIEQGLTLEHLEQLRLELEITRDISARALHDMTVWCNDNMLLRRENEELKRKDKDIHYCLVEIAELKRDVANLKKNLAQQGLLLDKAHDTAADLIRQRAELKRELAERDLQKNLAKGSDVKEDLVRENMGLRQKLLESKVQRQLEQEKMEKSCSAVATLRLKEEELTQKLAEREKASVAGSEIVNEDAVPEAPGPQPSSPVASHRLPDFADSLVSPKCLRGFPRIDCI